MSTRKELKGRPANGPESELSKFKSLWLSSLAEDARHFWRERFFSKDSQSTVRGEILAKLKINLRFDSQLTLFRQWVEKQDQRDEEAEKQQQDEADCQREHPDWSDEQRRMYVINCSLNRAIATGDFADLGMKAVKAGQNEKVISLDDRRLQLLEKKAAAFDAVKSAVNSGGVTPETLNKIERELKLL